MDSRDVGYAVGALEERNNDYMSRCIEFFWATDPKVNWHRVSIYHNAGVTKPSNEMFYKGAYNNGMPDLNLNLFQNVALITTTIF